LAANTLGSRATFAILYSWKNELLPAGGNNVTHGSSSTGSSTTATGSSATGVGALVAAHLFSDTPGSDTTGSSVTLQLLVAVQLMWERL